MLACRPFSFSNKLERPKNLWLLGDTLCVRLFCLLDPSFLGEITLLLAGNCYAEAAMRPWKSLCRKKANGPFPLLSGDANYHTPICLIIQLGVFQIPLIL